MGNKQFAERLNRELDAIGLPPHNNERVGAFAKLLKVPKFKAESYLSGVSVPDNNLIHVLARELEVNAEWLLGKSDRKKSEEN